MRTLELVKCLSEAEIKETDKLLKVQKRETLSILYDLLKKYRKRDDVPGNAEIFQLLFKKQYTADKNYLVRHELRLLNELLYDFLINKTISAYTQKHKSTYNYWLLRTFFDRKLNNAFSTDIDRFIKESSESIKPEDAAMMHDLKSLWMIYNNPKTTGNIQQMIDEVNRRKQEQVRHLKYRRREMESLSAYLQEALASVEGARADAPDDWRTPSQSNVDISPNENDLFEQYLILKKETFQTRGLPRIEVCKKKLAIEEDESYKSEFSDFNAQLGTLNNMALEYILMGMFAEADSCFKEIIKRCDEHKHPLSASLLQNYICNHINLGEYPAGIEIYNEYHKQIEAQKQYIPTLQGKIFCHLLLDEADEALACVPQNIKFTDHQHLMFRMVFMIAFIIRNQFDLAVNECQNIRRMIKANTGGYFETYNWITSLFWRYLQVITKSGKQQQQELAAIKNEIENGGEKNRKLVITEYSLRWLLNRLK